MLANALEQEASTTKGHSTTSEKEQEKILVDTLGQRPSTTNWDSKTIKRE